MPAAEAKSTESEESQTSAAEQEPPAVEMPLAVVAGAQRRGPTLELALYVILFLLALGLRLFALGGLNPISPWEAAQIWPAWLAHSFGLLEGSLLPEPAPPVSPLLFTLQRGLFFLTGGGNAFWARLLPACAGAGIVLAAWTLRRPMGRGGALMAALLFAFDPWFLSFSRMADSAALSLLTAVLLLGWLFDDSHSGQYTWLPVVCGLFLISGPLAWLLLPIIIFALVLRRGGPLSFLEGDRRRQAALVCAGTIVIGSTGLLAHISGLAAIGESVGAAIGHLTGDAGGVVPLLADGVYPLNWALLTLFVDEPFLLFVGGSGLIVALLRRDASSSGNPPREAEESEDDAAPHQSAAHSQFSRILAGGVGWGLLLILLPGRTPVSLLVLGLPLLLLAAGTAAAMLRFGLSQRLHHNQAGLLTLVTMGILLVTTFFWTGSLTEALRNGGYDIRLAAFYLLIPVFGVFFLFWSGARAGGQAFALLTLAALFLAQAGSSWKSNLSPEASQFRTIFAESGDKGIVLLAEDVARLSFLRAGYSTLAPVHLLVKTSHLPFFAWHLRSMRDLRWQPGLNISQLDDNALVVSQPGAGRQGEQISFPRRFIGSSYTATQRWLPTDLVGLGPRLRWILFRERENGSDGTPARQEVQLWVERE